MTDKKSVRRQIDITDEQLLTLINQRLQLAQTIGEIKNREDLATLDPKREQEVLDRLKRFNTGPLTEEGLRNIFREIISAARQVQRPLSVAFLGPEATFTHLAAIKKFGRSTFFKPLPTISEVFIAVEKSNHHLGVIPIENSTEGVVNETLDQFVETKLQICGEIYLEISHDLISRSGQINDIEIIYTHPHAHGQCRKWLQGHLPQIPVLEVSSTGLAAQKAAHNPNSAAIASGFAASLYELRVVESRIEDHRENATHFFIIGPYAPGATGADKTSIIFAVADTPGALYNMLRPLAERGINMTRIVSRPMKTVAWRYLFFVDLDGHLQESALQECLHEMEEMSAFFKILGSFPKAEAIEKVS
ncbi:prephenate dehydratase [Desulfobacca acetoxidans]|nr:prephenate dehydratase [Desulfobacterales bacterium]